MASRTAPAFRLARAIASGAALSALATGGIAARQQPDDLDRLLSTAADYVERFDTAFANVVAEERYVQTLGNSRGLPTRRRELVSDFLMVKLSSGDGWLPFRDVYSVDGQRVRDHDQRLVRLLSVPDPLALFQAQAIVAQSASYNIGVSRTMNLPILALQILRGANHARFEFSGVKAEPVEETPVFRIDYREHAHPTIITGPGGRDMPMSGQVWLQADGVVMRTELWIDDPASIRAVMTTRYRHDSEFGVAIPVEMREEYLERGGRKTSGLATYGRFRQFGVETSDAMGGLKR
ncbi:MAG: hypothetical protein IT184_12940 [Acidobacteria bacterium]|nr:hypothetical protein [Acidobacteriota bacterium]